VSLSAAPCTEPAGKSATAQILALQDRIDEALLSNKSEALAPLLAADATRTGPSGTITTRQQWLDSIDRRDIRYLSVKRRETSLRFYGDVAVVTGLVDIQVEKPGTGPVNELNRYLRVYVRQAGSWRLAAHQATGITPPR
jgi:ketosteroid isomerase-like protein